MEKKLSSNKILKAEKINEQTLATISGSSGAIWLVVLVCYNIFPKEYMTTTVVRLIAAFFSLILTYTFICKIETFNLKSILLCFFNSLLLFCNASGINAVSNNLAFTKASEKVASLLPFAKDVSWFPDKALLDTIQKQRNEILRNKSALELGRVDKQNEDTSKVSILQFGDTLAQPTVLTNLTDVQCSDLMIDYLTENQNALSIISRRTGRVTRVPMPGLIVTASYSRDCKLIAVAVRNKEQLYEVSLWDVATSSVIEKSIPFEKMTGRIVFGYDRDINMVTQNGKSVTHILRY